MSQVDYGAALQSFQKKNSDILQIIFGEKVKSDDVTEIVHTAQTLDTIIQKILDKPNWNIDPNSLSLKIFSRSLEKLDSLLNEFHKTLTDLVKKKQLARALNNTNLRRKIEQLSSSVSVEAATLAEKHSYLAKESGGSMQPHSLSKASSFIRRESISKDTIVIDDPDGFRMWERDLGPKTFRAEWDKFMNSLNSYLKTTIQPEQQKALRHILDNSNTGFVSSWKFSEFLKGFGPLRECINNVSKILSEKWFHGYLTMEEATKFLDFEPKGTFLVRFSSSRPGSFAIAWNNGVQQISHVMIENSSGGFLIKEGNSEKVFQNVNQIIQHYSQVLVRPFSSDLPEQPWFHGDIEASDAENLLKTKKPGTFLIRFSSRPGFFAGSYVDTHKNVAKCLIAASPYYIADDSMSSAKFNSMRELVENFHAIFKFPYSNTTNEVENAVRKKIITEMVETEETYMKALELLLKNFISPLLSMPKPPIDPSETKIIFSKIPELLGLHKMIHDEMKEVLDSWTEETNIGHIFCMMAEDSKFKLTDVYSDYVNNYNESMETLERCMKNSNFKKFIDNALANLAPNITSYLIQPIQRIPRYIMLVSDLLKHTTSEHPDFAQIQNGLDKLKKLADAINESKRKTETDKSKIEEIQANLIDFNKNLQVKGRSFIREGPLKEVDLKKKESKERYYFLFSDIFLQTKKKKDKYVFKHVSSCKNAEIQSMPDSTNDKHLFRVRFFGEKSDLILSAARPLEKEAWMKDLNKVAENSFTRSEPAPPEDLRRSLTSSSRSDSPAPSPHASSSSYPIPIKNSASSWASDDSFEIRSPVGSPSISRSVSPTPQRNSIEPEPESESTGEWREAVSPDGRRYFYNIITKKSVWSLPNEKVEKIGEWKEAKSKTGKTYYYNTVTKETSWTKPEQFLCTELL